MGGEGGRGGGGGDTVSSYYICYVIRGGGDNTTCIISRLSTCYAYAGICEPSHSSTRHNKGAATCENHTHLSLLSAAVDVRGAGCPVGAGKPTGRPPVALVQERIDLGLGLPTERTVDGETIEGIPTM